MTVCISAKYSKGRRKMCLNIFWERGVTAFLIELLFAKYSKGRRKMCLSVFWERGVTAFLIELLFYGPGGHFVI